MRQITPALALLALAAVFSSPATAQEIDIPYERFKLQNGLDVVVHTDRKAPIVAVSVWYKVGSKDEPQGRTGFAHLFEHLMFNGSENFDDEWFRPLQEAGATQVNGTTGFDRTNYYQTVPTTALDRVLWMESDRMGHLLGAIDQDKLDEQRAVVKNEKRQGENQPYGKVYGAVIPALFPEGHPYAHLPIGSMADLDAAELADVKDWFSTYYGPNNAVLALAGDISVEEAKRLAQKYFGDIPPGPPLTKWTAWVPQREAETRQVMLDQVPQARVYRVWATPEDASKTSTELYIAASVLGDGKNSRLYKSLVYDKQIATDVSVFAEELQMASIFGVVATVKPGETVEEVSAAIDAELAEFLEDGPTRDEVDLVSTKTRARVVRGLEQVGGPGGKGAVLAQGILAADDPAFYQRELEWLDEADADGVLDAARAWLADGAHQLDVLPFPDLAESGAGADRSALPAVSGETDLSFPAVEETTLSNGVKVVFARRDAVPVVNVALQFDAGYAADRDGELGAASFTMSMLDEGAGRRDALEISAALERLGATISAGSNLDVSTVELSTLKENLKPALDVMADVVREPTFPEEEIERLRKRWLASIDQELASPTSIALRLLPPLVYGDGHAYAIPLTGSGTKESISGLTREDLQTFRARWLRPDNATLFVVGDTTLQEVLPVLERSFGDWRAPNAPRGEKAVTPVDQADEGKVILIDRPGSPQSFILAGNIAPPTGVENNVAISAMNDALGGSFISRLNLNLREEKGWSYGVQSLLVGATGPRLFAVFAPVQSDKTGASLSEIRTEIEGFRGDDPPTAEEIARVKLDNVRSLPGAYETGDAVLGSLLSSARYGRPWDYPATLPQRYRALDAAAAAEAADEVLNPGGMVWVIIGDVSKIEDEVRALGLGPVEVRAMRDL